MPLTKADIVTRFNLLVANQLSPHRSSAIWHTGNLPTSGSGANPLIKYNPIGPKDEPLMDVSHLSDSDTSQFAASLIFSALHRFAMQYTRVRKGESWYREGTGNLSRDGTKAESWATNTCAFRADLAVTISIPDYPKPGDPVTLEALENFLITLKNRVNQVRSGANFTTPIISCHNSCHSNCHGSRGRR